MQNFRKLILLILLFISKLLGYDYINPLDESIIIKQIGTLKTSSSIDINQIHEKYKNNQFIKVENISKGQVGTS